MKHVICAFLLVPFLFSNEFTDNEKNWRKDREVRLKAEDGWLNLAGLYWLNDGVYTFGTDPGMDIVLPVHSAVSFAGTLTVKGQVISYNMERAQATYLNGVLLPAGELRPTSIRPDIEGPDILAYNQLRMFLIVRSDRLGLRLRDLKSDLLREFEGLSYFPPRPNYLVQAKLVPFNPPQKVFIATEIETETVLSSPGLLKFELKGQPCQLLALNSSDGDASVLFIMFTDKTTGIDTYASGRYLYAKRTEDGLYELNFNRAYNPPCAFTPYATCPLAPEENALPLAVKAGEKRYHSDQ
jgi:uncharacterized protein (DUF1684 family)